MGNCTTNERVLLKFVCSFARWIYLSFLWTMLRVFFSSDGIFTDASRVWRIPCERLRKINFPCFPSSTCSSSGKRVFPSVDIIFSQQFFPWQKTLISCSIKPEEKMTLSLVGKQRQINKIVKIIDQNNFPDDLSFTPPLLTEINGVFLFLLFMIVLKYNNFYVSRDYFDILWDTNCLFGKRKRVRQSAISWESTKS